MNTRISTRGRILLPAELRKRDGVVPGQVFDMVRLARGDYRIVRRKRSPTKGLVGWLRSCPVKGWFVPIGSESTDDL